MKKIIAIVVLVTIGIGVYVYMQQGANKPEERLNVFIESGLMSPLGGIYTNYIATEKQEAWATGHEVLSESLGLYMLAAYYGNDQHAFAESDAYLESYMRLPSNLYSWRINEEHLDLLSANATIDDLRIARAYYLAGRKWQRKDYTAKAQEISEALLTYAVQGTYMLNYMDGDERVDLSYLDIGTMDFLSELDPRWQPLKATSVDLISQGYLGDVFPFYHKVYNLDSEAYIMEPSINMIDALIVVLHLSEEKRVKQTTIDWLYAHLRDDVVYGNYRYGDWAPVNYEESTAVYGLIMRIASNQEDWTLYNMAKDKVEVLQVSNKTSPIYGAFAYEEALEVFSFDQLQMLVAYRRGGL